MTIMSDCFPKVSHPSDEVYGQLATLRSNIRQFLRFSEQTCRAAGIGALEYQALIAVRSLSPELATRDRLAYELILSARETGKILERLTSSGLVLVASAASDRRYRLVRLTDKGQAVLARLANKHLQQIQNSVKQLPQILILLSRNERAEDIQSRTKTGR